MSSFEACGNREPKAETKELLLEKARTLAKQAAEMSGGADTGPREYYYGASNFNPDIPAFTPPQGPLASPTSSPAANGSTQPQPTPPTTKFTLNPDSKAFVPSERVPHLTPKLKAGPASFIPPSQPTAPQPTEGATAVTAETETLSMSKTDVLVTIATGILYETSVDPSLYDDRMREFLDALKEGTVSDEALGSVAEAILQQGVASPTMSYVAARMCGSINDELEGFRRILLTRLQRIVKEALGRPAKEITHTASFFAEIFTRVTVSGQHINVLKAVLMQVLEKLFDTDASDSTVQTGCNILKLTGGILERGEGTPESQAEAKKAMGQVITRLSNLAREDSISSSTRALATRVIQLRGARWEHHSPKQEMAVANPVMSAEDDEGFVYFNTASSEVPAAPSKGSSTGVDWTEFVDEGGNPYCEEETQSASSGLEDQFDIDAEFEQFQEEEFWHYYDTSFTGEEGEEGIVEEEGRPEEGSPNQ